MKKTCLATLLVVLIVADLSYAQDQKPLIVRELGLTFANLNNFGIRYKCGNQKTLLRLTALSVDLSANNTWGRSQDSIENKSTGFGFGFNIGFEKRIPVVPKFNLILGSDFGIRYNYNKYKNDDIYSSYRFQKQWSVTPGIYFIFGAGYQIGTNFILSIEVSPSLTYTFGKEEFTRYGIETITTQSDLAFGLSNNSASITVAYRFTK